MIHLEKRENMEQKEKNPFRLPNIIITVAFWLLLGIGLGIVIWLWLTPKEDYRFTDENCRSFNQGWMLSGTQTPVTVPGNLEGEMTEVSIWNTIPEDIDNRTTILVQGLHQDVMVRIDGEIVGELNNEDTRRFGLHTPSGFIRIPIDEGDRGKIIEISYSSSNPKDAGQLNQVMIGSDIGLMFRMLEIYGIDLILAVLLLYTGLGVTIWGFGIRFFAKENPNVNITYLGITAICVAVWMLFESGIKQFYYGDLATGEMILWEAQFLTPIPMIFYINRLQERRYDRVYAISVAIAMLGNAVMMILELTNTYDFYDMYRFGWLIILGSGAVVVYGIVRDWIKGIRQWKLLVGILVLMLCVGLQMWGYLNTSSVFMVNKFISIGLIVFMMIMATSAMSSMQKQRQEQILAIKANETKSDFLANMSHEIRTPINAMLGFDEMILREESDERVIEYAKNIKLAGANLLSLINDILDFSKIEAGKMEIVEEEYKTSAMLTDVINMTYMKAQEKGLSFDIHIAKDIPRKLYGDEVRVKQIMTNILNNAVKYTEAGSVTLSVNYDKLGGDQGRLRISIADTGIGIKAEDINRITEAFQRFDRQKNRSIEGVGLGMSIVATLLKTMGGTLKIYSTYGKGSDFRLQIPQAFRDETPIGNYQNDYRKGLRKQEAYRELFTAPQARILFVDDNIMNLSVAKGLLKKTKIQIDTAESGVVCLELTRQNRYDLIFMDHLMPEMDGVETLRRLRRERGNPNQYVVVIALTANAIKGSREFYMKEGFQEYLTKPIEGEKLEEILLQLLPKEYIIPAEDEARAVMERLADEATGKLCAEPPEPPTTEDCMLELKGLLEQAHIDVSDGYHYAGNSMGQFHWMITLFAESYREKYRKLSTFHKERNGKMYTMEVHSLKSNAKGIGANTLYQLAWEHEQQSRNENWSYVQSHWQELCKEWLCVVNGIRNYIGEDPIVLEETAVEDEIAVTEQEEKLELTDEQRVILENIQTLLEDGNREAAMALLQMLFAK